MSIVRIVGVWKYFGATKALENLTLELGKGLHLLLGSNGSGKTTLLKLVCGLLKPTRGKIYVKDLDPWKERAKIMEFVNAEFEDNTIPWWLSGREFLRFVSDQRGIKWSEVVELAERLGVTSYWHRSIRGYSSGMRKRIILLSALIGHSEILILDEPYTLLDRESINVLNKIIAEKLSETEAIIVASHVFTGVEELATTITILANGRIVFHENIGKLLRSGKVSFECITDNPLKLVEELYNMGVKEIELTGNKVVFRSENEVASLVKAYECKPKLDIKSFYEKYYQI